MSVTGIKLLADTKAGLDNDGNAVYVTTYRVSSPLSQFPGHIGADLFTPVGGFTETTFNLAVQQATADRANFETENFEEFTAADVYGGRI